MMEPVTIVITTYDSGDGKRTQLCLMTIAGLLKNLSYPNLRWIIADDGSNYETHLAPIEQALKDKTYEISVVNRKGVGISKNTALQKAWNYSPYVLLLEDDWLLRNPLPLERYVEVLKNNSQVGMIRLGYLGTVGAMQATMRDFGYPNTFWELMRGSDVYVYSGQVSLRHKRFYDMCGYHPEGVDPGTEEETFCHHYNAVPDAPAILWPCEWGSTMNAGPFVNIGLDASLNKVTPDT